MAYCNIGYDNDSAYGDDSPRYDSFEYMLAQVSPPLTGSKRDADTFTDLHATSPELAVNEEHRAGRTEPRAQDCRRGCPESVPCAVSGGTRPSKRRASARRVSEYHGPAGGSSEPQSPSDEEVRFADFCQDCDLSLTCNSPCSVPCPGDGDCSTEDVCYNPACSPQSCTGACNDPECNKIAHPNDPCFCQSCNAQPCPLGDPGNGCHLAHSAPTPEDTIWCFDADCHLQNGHHLTDPTFAAYSSYPCPSQSHGATYCNLAIPTSAAVTPALSLGNETSLDSFSHRSSPPLSLSVHPTQRCHLDIVADHCHIDPSACCHGSSRQHNEFLPAFQDDLQLWNLCCAQSNGYDAFANFGIPESLPHGTFSPSLASTITTTPSLPSAYDNGSIGFMDSPWTFSNHPYSPTLPMTGLDTNHKIDYLISAANVNLKPTPPLFDARVAGSSAASEPAVRPASSTSNVMEVCMCKWQHSPGVLCLEIFDSPELLHKHIKAVHVESCAGCFCQWEGCEASDKDFRQRSKLSRHLLGHAGYRPYACSYDDCGKTFATNQARENHERTHSGDKPYKCEHCEYRTTTHTQLQTHIAALHHKRKIHQCPHCSFTCADSSNLSKHVRTHQTCRPYRCLHPGCTFKPDCRWENLKRHLKRSNHCPQLLIEDSLESKTYHENAKRERAEWQKRSEAGLALPLRRKGVKRESETPFSV